MSSCFSRCLRVPIAIRAFYKSYLWIPHTFSLTHLDFHPGLLTAFGNVYLHGSRPTRKERTISTAGRKRIADAQRARWAKIKGEKVISISSRKGGTMSPAARKRIAAAQKARWAKWRAQRKA